MEFTVERIKDAYAETSMIPRRFRFLDEGRGACAVGVLVYQKNGRRWVREQIEEDSDKYRTFAEELDVPLAYLMGVIRGFDNGRERSPSEYLFDPITAE